MLQPEGARSLIFLPKCVQNIDRSSKIGEILEYIEYSRFKIDYHRKISTFTDHGGTDILGREKISVFQIYLDNDKISVEDDGIIKQYKVILTPHKK